MKRIVSLLVIALTATAAYFYLDALDVDAVSASFFTSVDWLRPTHSAYRAPVNDKAKFGFIDKHGRFAIEAKLDDCLSFSEGLAAFRRGGRWGYMDRNGKEVISPRFTKAADFHYGFAKVNSGIYTGYIDKSGNFAVPAHYADGSDFDAQGLAIVKLSHRLEFVIDSRGRRLSEEGISRIFPRSEGTFTAQSDGKYGLIDTAGKWLIKPEYDALSDCREGLLAFARNGRWGYLDRNGIIVLPAVYSQASPFCEGVAAVRRADGCCALINRKGETTLVFPPQCKAIFSCQRGNNRSVREQYEGGLVPVLENMRWGYMSAQSGNFEIKPQFAYAEPFKNGLAKVAVLDENEYVKIQADMSEAKEIGSGIDGEAVVEDGPDEQ
ncbi:MAG TPA: WG repeat-containing protein [Candidatus Melainabacteria bacterium]|nr:WG repeat-containing protein [Candidatus Melainabacteria bacterium]